MRKRKIIALLAILAVLQLNVNADTMPDNKQKESDSTVNSTSVETVPFFEEYFFVGFAEVYSGINKNDGDIELIEDSTDYKEHYSKGRINLYLKGKIKGKFLLTTWLDTEENELDKVFNNLTEREKNSIFEKIDPEEYYPVYGDDSAKVKDVATSGKLYVALESEKFRLLWGNYRVNFNENNLISYNKSSYGLNTTYSGDKLGLNAFTNSPDSLTATDTIESTGGMLYYLNNDDILIDSETIKVELRDATTDRVLNSLSLIQGDDYEISYTSGRIVLNKNINAYFSDSMIEGFDGYDTYYLVANYDYELDSSDPDDENYGLETSIKANDENKLTADYIKNKQDDGETYEIYGLDWTHESEKTKFKTGFATSKNELTESSLSTDGGLNYEQETIFTNDENPNAWSVELERKIDETKKVSTYYTFKEEGFSNGTSLTSEDEKNYGLELSGEVYSTDSKFTYDKKVREAEETDLFTVASNKKQSDKLTLKSELEYEVDTDKSDDDNQETDLTGALGLSYMLTENKEVYASQQVTLANSEDKANNLAKLGTNITHNKWRVNGEVGAGNQKNMMKLETGYMLNEKSEIYTGVERSFSDSNGMDTTNTLGTKTALNERTDLYGELQTGETNSETSQSSVVGVDYIPAEKWVLSLDYTKSDVKQKSGGETERDIITAGTSYKGERLKKKIKAEHRKDSGNNSLTQNIFTTDIEWKQNENLRYLLEGDFSRTVESDIETEKYIKGAFGLAYRPVNHDRLNLLSKYTYYEEIDSNYDEDSYQGEKANVFAIEGIYDINSKWQFGEKIGYKKAEVMLVEGDDEWYDSNTWLYIAKLNYRFNKTLDLTGEYKYLTNDLAEDEKHGTQFGIYKRFPNSLKMGIGYNFAEFNDDLTNLDYKSKGVFINIVKAW